MKNKKKNNAPESFVVSEERLLKVISQSLQQQSLMDVNEQPITDSMRRTVKRFTDSFFRVANT